MPCSPVISSSGIRVAWSRSTRKSTSARRHRWTRQAHNGTVLVACRLTKVVPVFPRRLTFTLGSVALVLLAVPFAARQIDDLYITVAYAHEWLDHGVLRWSSGEVVEGYSHFLWLVALLPWIAAGIDPGLGAKVMSLVASVAYLGALAAALPRDARAVPPIAAVVGWAPFAYWSALGLETTAFGLFAALGWAACASDRRGIGILSLVVASLLRPEGHAWLALGAAASIASMPRWRREDSLAVAAIAALIVYHAVRIGYFGHVLPTPALAKVVASEPFRLGVEQLGREFPTLIGIAAALATFRFERRRDLAWIAAPFLLHVGLLLKLGGDWMGWARMLLPAVMAAILTAARVGERRAIRAPSVLVGLLVVVGSVFECGGRDDGGFAFRSWQAPSWGLNTPCEVDVEWVVERVPADSIVLTGDVGMVGNVPRARIRDFNGLVDRESAEIRAGLRTFDGVDWRDRYGPGPDQIGTLHAPARTPDDVVVDGWLAERLPYPELAHRLPVPTVWLRAVAAPPPREVVNARWRALASRFPAQPFLQWRARMAEADSGGAVSDDTSFTSGPVPLRWVEGRGFPLYWNTRLGSRPIGADDIARGALVVDVDDPGDEGALLRVQSLSCDTTRAAHRHERWPLADVCAAISPGERLTVSLLNDASGDGFDRNAWVLLTR